MKKIMIAVLVFLLTAFVWAEGVWETVEEEATDHWLRSVWLSNHPRSSLLLENSYFLLLEDGSQKLLLEQEIQ